MASLKFFICRKMWRCISGGADSKGVEDLVGGGKGGRWTQHPPGRHLCVPEWLSAGGERSPKRYLRGLVLPVGHPDCGCENGIAGSAGPINVYDLLSVRLTERGSSGWLLIMIRYCGGLRIQHGDDVLVNNEMRGNTYLVRP